VGEKKDLRSAVRRVWSVRGRVRARDLAPSSSVAQQVLIDALDSASESISSAGSVHGVMTAIVDAAKGFTGADKVVVCLVDEYADGPVMDETTLVVRGARGTHVRNGGAHI